MPNYRSDVFSLDEQNGVEFAMQLNSGDVGVTADGSGFLHQADAAGQLITKSTVNAGFAPIEDGGTIVIEMDFMIPVGAPVDQIFLADFESSNANTGTHPGVRVYLSDGMIRVDRSKIGLDTWYGVNDPITAGDWYSQRIELLSGGEDAGRMRIYLNDELVMDATGSTTLSQDIMEQYGWNLQGGMLDRVQVGLTANNGAREASLATRNISVEVSDPSTDLDLDFQLDPSSLVGNAEEPITVLPPEISYLDTSVPDTVTVNSLRDCAPPGGVKTADKGAIIGAKFAYSAKQDGNETLKSNQVAAESTAQDNQSSLQSDRETPLSYEAADEQFIFEEHAEGRTILELEVAQTASFAEPELQTVESVEFWQNYTSKGLHSELTQGRAYDALQRFDTEYSDASSTEAAEALVLTSLAEMDISF